MKEYRLQVEMFSLISYLSFVMNLWFVANYETFKDNYLINNFLYPITISIFSATALALLLAWRAFGNERERYCNMLYNQIALLFWVLIDNKLITQNICKKLQEENFLENNNIFQPFIDNIQRLSTGLIELQKMKGIELSNGETPDIYFNIINNTLNSIGFDLINIFKTPKIIRSQCPNADKNKIQKQLSELFHPFSLRYTENMKIIDENMSKITTFFQWDSWEKQKELYYNLRAE